MRLRRGLALAALALSPACNGAKPPTAPAAVVQSVQVNTTGNASTTLAPGETRQLSAVATRGDGSTSDVTTLATWQSSAPAVATVSPGGLVTAAAEGSVEITATYNNTRGALRAEIRPTCAVSVSPAAASFNAFGGSGSATVTVNAASCGWSVKSDAPWWPFTFEPAVSGSGTFAYTVPQNSSPSARTASLIVETSTAQRAAVSITVDRPLGCSYVTQPEHVSFTASGGTGQFTVITTPGDCRWNLINGMQALGVSITSGFGGVGSAVVRYSVQAHTRSVDADGYLEIAGLSGLNPNGRHHIILLKR